MKKIFILSIIIFSTTVFAAGACGESPNLCEIAEKMIPSFTSNSSLNKFLYAICYVLGIVFVIKSALKLKEHSESKGQVKLIVPVMYFVAGSIFITLPSALDVGSGFLFGGEASTSSNTNNPKY